MKTRLARLATVLVAATGISLLLAAPASADPPVAHGHKVCPNGQYVKISSLHHAPYQVSKIQHVFYSSSNDPWITREHAINGVEQTVQTPTWRQSAYWRVYVPREVSGPKFFGGAKATCVPL